MSWDNQYYWRVKPIYLNSDLENWINVNSFYISSPKHNDSGFIDIETYNEDLIQNGLTVYGDPWRKRSIVFDEDGREIWNCGNNFRIKFPPN